MKASKIYLTKYLSIDVTTCLIKSGLPIYIYYLYDELISLEDVSHVFI